jgi:hypothetical protein
LADTVVLRRRFTLEGENGRSNGREHVLEIYKLFSSLSSADEDTLVHPGDKLPADTLALSMRSIWEVIKSQKDLNLPAHKVLCLQDSNLQECSVTLVPP